MSALLARRLALVGGLASLVGAADLGARVFATNDEARFPLLAQAMLSDRSWWPPMLNGSPYYNKPPLLAWLVALTSMPVGHVTQLTAVVPSAAAAVGTALLLWMLGRELFGNEAGIYAALVGMTTQGFFLHGRLPMPDMLMTFFITASLLALWRMTRNPSEPYWLLFYPLVGAAFWAKGSAGLMPLAVALAWASRERGLGRWRRLRLPTGIVILAAVIAPWWRLVLSRGPGVRHGVAGDQLWWYLPGGPTLGSLVVPAQNVFGILVPWIFVVPFALVQALRFLRGRGVERDGVAFALGWAAVTLVLVAVSREQRLRYYLPLVPPVSLLVGWWWAGAVVRRRQPARIPWRVYAAGLAVFGVISLGLMASRGHWPKDLDVSLPASLAEVLLLAGAAIAGVGAVADGLLNDRLGRRFGLAWVASALVLFAGYHWELARRNAAYDYPRVAERLSRGGAAAPLVAAWGVPELPLAFYLGRPVVSVSAEVELRHILDSPGGATVVLTDAALSRAGDPLLVVFARGRVGSQGITLVRNRPPVAAATGP